MFGITITHCRIFAGTKLIATYTKDDTFIYIIFEGDTYTIENNEEVFHAAIENLCLYGNVVSPAENEVWYSINIRTKN